MALGEKGATGLGAVGLGAASEEHCMVGPVMVEGAGVPFLTRATDKNGSFRVGRQQMRCGRRRMEDQLMQHYTRTWGGGCRWGSAHNRGGEQQRAASVALGGTNVGVCATTGTHSSKGVGSKGRVGAPRGPDGKRAKVLIPQKPFKRAGWRSDRGGGRG